MNKLAAYHEAGHAVAFLKLGFRIDEVSIRRTEDTVGHVMLEPKKEHIYALFGDYRIVHRRVIATYTGYSAEHYFMPESSSVGTAAADLDTIAEMLSWHHRTKSRMERIQWILYQKSQTFVVRNRLAIAAVAQVLMQSVSIDHRTVKKIVRRVESENGSLVMGAPW